MISTPYLIVSADEAFKDYFESLPLRWKIWKKIRYFYKSIPLSDLDEKRAFFIAVLKEGEKIGETNSSIE